MNEPKSLHGTRTLTGFGRLAARGGLRIVRGFAWCLRKMTASGHKHASRLELWTDRKERELGAGPHG